VTDDEVIGGGPAGRHVGPLAVLADIERRALAAARPLPGGEPQGDTLAHYIAFRLRAEPAEPIAFVLPMREVLEVLALPWISRVPAAQPWLLGVAQLRGRLLSVVDLRRFLGRGTTEVARGTRMLVLDAGDYLTGLVVDEVAGLKQGGLPVAPGAGIPDWAAGIVSGCIEVEGERWALVSARSLLEDPRFLEAAA
jgi:twitching motility protein PilI